jgi:phage tail sheath protein FI
MPVTLSYPGVYIEELSSGVHTITGVATSITAFIGSALRGPTDLATRIQSYADYERTFGALDASSTLGYAVQHYFQHGGTDAYIVRVAGANAAKASFALPTKTAGKPLNLVATGAGDWANDLQVAVSYDDTKDPATLFTLRIKKPIEPGSANLVDVETFINLSISPTHERYVKSVLKGSALLNVDGVIPLERPEDTKTTPVPVDAAKKGVNGDAVDGTKITTATLQAERQGIYALDAVDLFNLLYIPPFARDTDVDTSTLAAAAKYCTDHRALLIADLSLAWAAETPGDEVTKAVAAINALRAAATADKTNVAVYYPRLLMADPLQQGRSASFGAGGAVAGIMARTDAQRGVWKAPAGLDAGFSGVRELSYKLDDRANGRLNPLGLNCVRSFPVFGNVVWGARTLAGADVLGSEWKYVPVRRLTLFIEESLYRGTQWAVFEPNDEPLWSQIRLNLGAFMHNLFVQGAFQGAAPRDAYFVKCDKETTPQNAIDLGIVNIVVGFAPLKPAEFVVIKIQQIAGQIQA